MPAFGAIPGLSLCLAATILLVFVSVSSPNWESIYFLQAGDTTSRIRFGVFGFTNSTTRIGYKGLDLTRMGLNPDALVSTIRLENLSTALVLHPIAAGLGGVAVLFGLCGTNYHRSGTVSMMIFAGLATLVTLAVWIIDMVLFAVLRSQFREQDIPTKFGNATWMTLAAFVAFGLGSLCGICGSYRKRKSQTSIA